MKHNWEYKPIADCFNYIKNGPNIKQSKEACGYPITRIETLANGVFNHNKVGYANIFELGKYEQNVLNNGDLLMSHINSKSYVGRTVVYYTKFDETIIHGMNLLRLIPTSELLSKYFYYISLTHYFKDRIANIRKDSVNQSSFSISDLKKIPIPVPPMAVQERIVAELDKINEVIEKCRELLRTLDSLAQSIFYDTFGDPISNPKGWPCVEVNYFIESKNNIRRASKTYVSTEVISYVDISSVDRVSNSITNITKYSFGEAPSRAQQVIEYNDILISLVRPNLRNIAINHIHGNKIVASSGFCILRSNSKAVSEYLLFLCISNSVTDYLCSKISGAAYPAITEKDIRNMRVALPPLTLQQQFAAQIKAIEAEKARVEAMIAELQTLLDARIDYWFN